MKNIRFPDNMDHRVTNFQDGVNLNMNVSKLLILGSPTTPGVITCLDLYVMESLYSSIILATLKLLQFFFHERERRVLNFQEKRIVASTKQLKTSQGVVTCKDVMSLIHTEMSRNRMSGYHAFNIHNVLPTAIVQCTH